MWKQLQQEKKMMFIVISMEAPINWKNEITMSFARQKKWDNDELLIIILWKHQQLQKKTLWRQHELKKKKDVVFVEAPTTK